LSIVLTGDAQVRRLNRQYRGQDKPTNVLSFAAGAEADPLLGDVVIAFGVTRREAANENKALAAHLTHLVIHGVLHLLGYDHIRDKDAHVMERRESAIMARMGLADPYADVSVPPRR
jgi:probable rRNA maturation factor